MVPAGHLSCFLTAIFLHHERIVAFAALFITGWRRKVSITLAHHSCGALDYTVQTPRRACSQVSQICDPAVTQFGSLREAGVGEQLAYRDNGEDDSKWCRLMIQVSKPRGRRPCTSAIG